jgi:protein-L-isoaspartate(D-aspartate) O-methyltransferase
MGFQQAAPGCQVREGAALLRSRARERASTARASLVQALREQRGIRDRAVLDAIGTVPRERFVPCDLRELAYEDRALPIAEHQTISQPFIVATMTALALSGPGKRVLEIGTGCGYQTAVLAAAGAEVYSVEILEPLARAAATRLRELGVSAHLVVGDGHRGLPEFAPYDAIVVTAAPLEVPRALVEQLAPGGRLVCPIGPAGGDQDLIVLRKTPEGEHRQVVAPVRFVPMTGTR